MRERLPAIPPPAEPAVQPETGWDLAAVSASLNTSAEPLVDRFAGPGQVFRLPGEVAIALFPERHVVRLSTPLAEFVIGPVAQLGPQADRLRIEAEDATQRAVALLDPQGGVIVTLQPRLPAAAAAPAIIEAVVAEAEIPPANAAPPEATAASTPVTSTSSDDKTTASEAAPAPAEEERRERLVFTGRVGRTPELTTTAKGRKLVRMPLAVHQGEETHWHTVVCFDALAERAAATLTKGQLVSVVGYKHVREVPTKRGVKQQELIFAAALQGPRQAPTA